MSKDIKVKQAFIANKKQTMNSTEDMTPYHKITDSKQLNSTAAKCVWVHENKFYSHDSVVSILPNSTG